MGLLIDTSVIVALERQKGVPAELAVRAGSQEVYLSAVTASELLHGVHRAGQESIRKRRSAFIEDAIRLFPILPFDLEVAREHARIWADLSRQGMLIGAHDLMIAATALAHDLSLVTFNAREFSRVQDLTLVTWEAQETDPPRSAPEQGPV